MSKTVEKTQKKAEKESENIVEKTINKIKDNDFFVHFYCPSINQPSGGIGVLLRIASTFQKNGQKVKIWYEPHLNQEASIKASQKTKKETLIFDEFKPTWVDFSIKDIEFIPLGSKENQEVVFTSGKREKAFALKVSPEDFMFIPEGFPNIMERTQSVSCKRIVLAQSWLYILAGMRNGQIWQGFGIKDVVSVSDCITDYVKALMPGIQVKSLKQGINREIFYPPKKRSEKYPIIGYQKGRGPESQMKTHSAIKMFYAANPHMRWWRFVELNGMGREEFAERLRDCAFVLYTDDIAGFGTLPLEAMACGTHVVGYNAPGGSEYVNSDNGFWVENGNVFQLAEFLGLAVEKWVSGDMDVPQIQEDYEKTLSNYTLEGEEKRILEIIEEYKKQRIDELEGTQKK